MKAIILTATFLVTSFIGQSQKNQFVTLVDNEYYVQVDREWYKIDLPEFQNIKYITSDEYWIKSYLEEILSKDGISIKKPDERLFRNGKVFYMEWVYKQSDGRTIFVAYVYNSVDSCDISIQYLD
jgi:hypothetical protein